MEVFVRPALELARRRITRRYRRLLKLGRRIDDASHWVINEQPGTVNAAIREFLA